MGKPDFIIIGETKCGTTSLYNYLIKHPNILDTYGNGEGYDRAYATKEIRFFDRFYDRGIDWYLSRFPETAEHEITGEATPMYMYRTMVAQRLYKHLPDTKLIVLLRNPVDRLTSNFYHNFKWVPGWKERYPDLKQYLNSCSDSDYYHIDKGIYYYSLLRWYEYFPKEQVYILKSEDLYSDPEGEYMKLLSFLGVRAFLPEDFPVYRANNYESVDLDLKELLQNFYRPYNHLLEELLSRKMNWF